MRPLDTESLILDYTYRIIALFGTCASTRIYRCSEVNCNIYNIGVAAFSIKSQNAIFRLSKSVILYHKHFYCSLVILTHDTQS